MLEIVYSSSQDARRHALGRKGLKGAGPESGKDVIPIGRKEIPIPGPGDPCARSPASATQHFSSSKPWLGIILVGVSGKSGKRCEVGGCPFPNITEHLSAAECAVACRAGGNVERGVEGKVEIGMLARRCGAAPRPSPLHPGKTAAFGARLTEGRRFPFHLGRQSAPRPAAPCLGLVPVDERNRRVRSKRHGPIIAAPRPGAIRFRLPVDWTFGTNTLQLPALSTVRNGFSRDAGVVGSVVYGGFGNDCGGAFSTPENTWFHTPFDHGPITLLRISHCCCEPLVTAPMRESAMKPPLAYCGPAVQ